MNPLHAKLGFLCDMDGVIYHGNRLLPGVETFVRWLDETGKKFLFLTNGSQLSPRELSQKLARLGLQVAESHFYTSALATAAFLASQKPGATLYVIGDPGLITALYEAGFSMNDVNPDYVVVGETRSYNFEKIERAIRCVLRGARLIGANPDLTGPVEDGIVPATGALMAPIELSTGVKAYYVGKPNPLMMRHALRQLGCRREDTAIIGDRMDTDIIAGIESDMQSVLVLSGVARREDLPGFSWCPSYVLDGVGDIVLPELPNANS
jgi:NagD protein